MLLDFLSRVYHLCYEPEWHAKQGDAKQLTPDEVAYGFIRVANETMCRPIRALTEARGHDPVTF